MFNGWRALFLRRTAKPRSAQGTRTMSMSCFPVATRLRDDRHRQGKPSFLSALCAFAAPIVGNRLSGQPPAHRRGPPA